MASSTTASVVARATAAPLVLVIVLASHVSLRWSSDLTPWKGGGFGMFSTVDSPASRVVRVELVTDVGTMSVASPSALGDLVSAAKAAPSTGRLVRLAEELAEQWWIVPDLASLAESGSEEDPGEDEALRGLAVEALTQILPVEAVQAIDPARFDESAHRRLDVRGVTVAVLRLEPDGGDGQGQVLHAQPIRAVTLDLVPRHGEAGP